MFRLNQRIRHGYSALRLIRSQPKWLAKRIPQKLSTKTLHRSLSSLSSQSSQINTTSHSDSVGFHQGDVIHGYRVETVEEVAELCLTAYRLRHTRTGAEHLHISRDDSNNVFSVSFRTTPTDSTGVAHILEHLALCGSNKFPVRDPFMKMLTRSLSTFMNAFTGPDYTMYPFSTQNSKDYYNLLAIYLDAVFHPRLRELDFLQEGWRLEHAEVGDQQSPLVFKGVVFNEMKGVFSSSASIYSRGLLNKIFPDNTYRNESGGDPLEIPALSYEQLKEFHSKHYHPSNARFFTYGNFPLENHLEAIDQVIGNFEENSTLKQLSFVDNQNKWKSSRHEKITCQVDPLAAFPDKQTTVGVSYMLQSIVDTEENFNLAILCSLLVDGPSSPLYQALIDSGLGSDYSPFTGYQNFTKQTLFSVGLQGISQDRVQTVLKAINMALKNAYTEGFPQERIDAILHRIELHTKHQSSNFGLGLIMNLNCAWNHGANLIDCLRVNKHVEKLKQNLTSDKRFLQKKVKQYFLDNQHRLVIEMSPSADYETLQQEAEQALLETKLSTLSEKDKQCILENGIALQEAQNAQEDLSVLPTLTIKDIPRSLSVATIERLTVGDVPVQYSAQPTNGIVYFNSLIPLNLQDLPKNLLPFLPLLCQVMTKLGAANRDRKELDQEIQLKTGGLFSSTQIVDHYSQFDQFESGIYLHSHCLERNLQSMFDLWTDVFNQIRFDDDPEHLIQQIRICSAELAASVPSNGHRYAMNRAASFFGGAFKLRELTSGMSSLAYFRYLASCSNEKIKEITENLKKLAELAFNARTMRCAINAEASTIRPSLQVLEKFIGSIPSSEVGLNSKATTELVMPTLQSNLNEHFVFPFSTNYLGKAVFCAPFTHADFAKLRIASSLVSAKFLHKEIREKGGAYGGGAKFDSGGVFHFYSYRDPHITETMTAFEQAGEWLLRPDHYGTPDIDEAKLQVFQSIDQPIPPSSQGLEYFLTGITNEMKQDYRLRLLEVTKADIQEVAERYLIGNTQLQSGVILLGPNSEVTGSQADKWKIQMIQSQ